MKYLRLALCIIGAVFVAALLPSFFFALKTGISEKATGVGVVAGSLSEIILSPLFWIIAALFFSLFRWASRSGQPLVRVLLFWVPSVTTSVLGIAFLTLFTYTYLHFRHP